MTSEFRSEFPVTNRWAFLNHANVAPLSQRARDRVQQWADDVATNGDVHMEAWFQEIELVRRSAAWLLGADPKEIAFLKSTSDGIALVAEGFPWRPGDNLVLPEGEYPANVYPWLHLEEKGVRVKTVPCRDTRVAIEDVAAAIDAATRLLSVSFVQFATGFRSDLTALGNLCQARQIDFCVDAIQGLGVFPIDVRAMHIDYLSANSHKWLISPQGASIFYINQAKLDKIRPNSVGWKSVADPHSYSRLDYRLKDDASRFESGSFIVPSIVGLGASLSLLEEVGISRISTLVKAVTDYLIERLQAIGGQIVSSRLREEWSGIVSFILPGQDPTLVVQRCQERNVIISSRAGRLRVSPHFYNNYEDIDKLLEVLAGL